MTIMLRGVDYAKRTASIKSTAQTLLVNLCITWALVRTWVHVLSENFRIQN
jgi:hypothetical protein